MKLLLIRHAKAEEHDASRWPDDSQRPLSSTGDTRFRKAAENLARNVRPDAILASPYLRTVQTASILTEVAGWPAAHLLDDVARGDFDGLVAEHLEQGTDCLAIIGHEPSISGYISRLITGVASTSIRVRPGTAAMIHLSSASTGELQWLAPTQLFT